MRALVAVLAVLVMSTSAMLVRVSLLNRDLRAQASGNSLPEAVDHVPTLRLPTLAGDSIYLAAGKRQTLLVFTTDCPFCSETMPAWRSILEDVRSAGEVVAVSLDSVDLTTAYLRANPLPVPVVSMEARVADLYGLGPVPHILTIDEGGKIVYSRLGSLAEVAPLVLDSIKQQIGAEGPRA